MGKALKGLVGYYDFKAFQRAGSNRSHSYTTIQEVEIERKGDLVVLEIQASGFLYGMVRLLVGQLVAVGEKKLPLEVFEKRWKEGLRQEVKESAPSKGLCFLRAGYSDSFFTNNICYDSFPKFFMTSRDSPKK